MKKTRILIFTILFIIIFSTFATANILSQLKKIENVKTEKQVIASTSLQNQVPLGQGFTNNNYFDITIQDDDISSLFVGAINFQGTEYDTSEELQLCSAYSEPYIATSLMSDDDYHRDVFFEMNKDVLKLAYKFDEFIDLTTATISDPLIIDFLGYNLKIFDVQDNQFSNLGGVEYLLNAGDSVEVLGKTVTLENVGSNSAQISVDGVSQSISVGSTITIEGIDVYMLYVISRTELEESSAAFIAGENIIQTYRDGDAFIGEDLNDPNWVWDIRNLAQNGTSMYADCNDANDNLILRIENDMALNDDTDDSPGTGQCLDLPNNFLSICLDSLTIPEDEYKDFIMEFNTDADLSDAGCSNMDIDSSVPAIHLTTTQTDGLDLEPFIESEGIILNVSLSTQASEMWLVLDDKACNNVGLDNDLWLNVFYKTTESLRKAKFFGAINLANQQALDSFNQDLISDQSLFKFNYINTVEDNIKLGVSSASSTDINFLLQVRSDIPEELYGSYESLRMNFGLDAEKHFFALGDLRATEEREEFAWIPGGKWFETFIGTKDEDHRTAYGIIIENPKLSSSSDSIKLLIPSDMVKANIMIGQDIYNQPVNPKIKVFYRDLKGTQLPKLLGEFEGEANNLLRIQGTNDNFNLIFSRMGNILVFEDALWLSLRTLLDQKYVRIHSYWKIENNQLQSLGNLKGVAEAQELEIFEGDVIGNGESYDDIITSTGVIILKPRTYAQSDSIRLSLPQDVRIEFEECSNDLVYADSTLDCENVIHISSNICEEGFAIMAGENQRFTTDAWIVVTGPRNETNEQPLVQCVDKDNGINIYEKSLCYDGTEVINEDACMKSGMLQEWYCNSTCEYSNNSGACSRDMCMSDYISCPESFVCFKGECIRQTAKNSWFTRLLGRVLG
ncbi:MAG: hypothetical protein KKA65_00915 [Nanoarchaeota archaeon]|nr:hypothetical protein [Nanoarchaeota archaeon]MBU4456039.1 hypothetical protein [Nanoarchaeota archaeon]